MPKECRASLLALLSILALISFPATAQEASEFREDAESIEQIINDNYAYLDRFDEEAMPITDALRTEASNVNDGRSLLRYAERAILTLADHHAITGSSFSDSWALVPSYSDLWIELDGADYRVTAVRENSPAAQAGIASGSRLNSVGGVPIRAAVSEFWRDLGYGGEQSEERRAFAARVLVAGRRDRSRQIGIQHADGQSRTFELPSIYGEPESGAQLVTVLWSLSALEIVINDSLGNSATIAAFDEAMTSANEGQHVIIDLRNTPSGGNTVIARAMLGWFVTEPTPYQIHNLPSEQRETGIARQWVEQVIPRNGRHHDGPVTVLVGRWTGSMGEGLAVAFDAIGANVTGDRMAGLLGAITDNPLPHSGFVIKIPTERLMAVDGSPREEFVPNESATR